MFKNFVLTFTAILAVIGGVLFFYHPAVGPSLGGTGTDTVATTAQVLVGTTPVMLVATSTSRIWTLITTTSTSVFLGFHGPKTAVTGAYLQSPTEFNQTERPFTGAIWATNNGATGSVSVTTMEIQ